MNNEEWISKNDFALENTMLLFRAVDASGFDWMQKHINRELTRTNENLNKKTKEIFFNRDGRDERDKNKKTKINF